MNADTLLTIQVAALVLIAIELALVLVVLGYLGVEVLEFLPELIEALREADR